MSAPKPVVKKNWPRWAVGPLGNRALFHCAGDVMPGWKLETPLPGAEPLVVETISEPPKNKGGRPRKVAPDV